MLTTYLAYHVSARDIDAAINRVQSQPMVERETAYYLENIENVETIEDLVSDRRLFAYAMKAHGLEDMTYARAFMTKVLEGGRDDPESLANTLTDSRYKEFAETFDFVRYEDVATTFTKARQGVVDRYLRQTLEEDAGASNEGVRLALYFDRKAPELESVYGILADPALSEVVRTILQMPDSIAALDIDRQAEMISARLDLEDLKDDEMRRALIDRFTNLWDATQSTASVGVPAVFSQSPSYGIGTDVMLAMQGLKR